MGPILAIDYGDARVGVAVSDDTRSYVFPRKAIVRTGGMPSLIDALREIATKDRVSGIVVGLPLSLDGTEGPQARTVRKAAESIGRGLGLPVEFEDERLTSSYAERYRGSSIDPDSIAAAEILQCHLERRGRSVP